MCTYFSKPGKRKKVLAELNAIKMFGWLATFGQVVMRQV